MDYMDMLKGGLLGLTTDTLGAPVDLATMAMRPLGYNVQKPVMGSDWLADKLSSKPKTGAGQAARVVGGLLSPDPMDAVKLAGLLGMAKMKHGSSALFDEFELQKSRNPALFFSPPSRTGSKTQAEHIAEGPFGGYLYDVDVSKGKQFDPLNNEQAAKLYKKLFPDREVRQWVEYPDIYIDSPLINAMNRHGYNSVKVYEPSVRDFSFAITDPSLAKIEKVTKIK